MGPFFPSPLASRRLDSREYSIASMSRLSPQSILPRQEVFSRRRCPTTETPESRALIARQGIRERRQACPACFDSNFMKSLRSPADPEESRDDVSAAFSLPSRRDRQRSIEQLAARSTCGRSTMVDGSSQVTVSRKGLFTGLSTAGKILEN